MKGGDIKMMGLEKIKLWKIERRMVEKEILKKEEIEWMKKYKEKVREKI